MIHNEDELFVKPGCRFWFPVKGKLRRMEQLVSLVGDELVADIVFVLKIQIEGALRNPGLLYDIGDGGRIDPLRDKEFVGAVKQCFFFLFFIFINFPHYNSTILS